MNGDEKSLQIDLRKTADILPDNWVIQNNTYDKRTNFIYNVDTLDDCLIEIERTGADKEYALHRWYNYMTSIKCENIFCDYGAVHEQDKYNHDVDIYIDGVPFDVKVTVYPNALSNRPYDLDTRQGKDDMIQWFYDNQSHQSRQQYLNRLYVVCDAPSVKEKNIMKCNFQLMRERISAYMQLVPKNGLHNMTILNWDRSSGLSYQLYTDLILLD